VEEKKKLIGHVSEQCFKQASMAKKMRENYRIYEMLGEGAYGEVRKCVWRQNMEDKKSKIKEFRAVKILSKNYMEAKNILSFENEVSCMQELCHPHIMNLHHFYEDSKRYMLVQELSQGGDLFDYLKQKDKLEEIEVARIMKQIFSGLHYMHNTLNKEYGICHRDLKLENILLENQNDISHIKIIDFGTAERFYNEYGVEYFQKDNTVTKLDDKGEEIQVTPKTYKNDNETYRRTSLSGCQGTVSYMAPEVMNAQKESRDKDELLDHHFYTEKCDNWSVGVMAYFLRLKKMPIKEENTMANKKEIKAYHQRIMNFDAQNAECFKDSDFQTSLSKEFQYFLKCLITQNVEPSSQDIKNMKEEELEIHS